MMWIPTAICIAFTGIFLRAATLLVRDQDDRITHVGVAAGATLGGIATAIAAVEAARQSGWLP